MLSGHPALLAECHEALGATRRAIHHYANACRELQTSSSTLLQDQMSLRLRRLQALEKDLDRRLRRPGNEQAFYTTLGVIHAGLRSLAEASAELHASYETAMGAPPPAEGWFMDEPEAVPVAEEPDLSVAEQPALSDPETAEKQP